MVWSTKPAVLLLMWALGAVAHSGPNDILTDHYFDCGENKTISADYICDGDEDCFWGEDEDRYMCRRYLNTDEETADRKKHKTNSDVRWLNKYLEGDYLKAGGCGEPDVLPKFRQRRLVKGERSVRGSWPWQTALRKVDEDLIYCGGTLIHSQWVLTAAHCVESLEGDVKNLELLFGKHDVMRSEAGTSIRAASKLYKHPNHRYPAHKSNDIALIKLSKPVDLTVYVHLACLPRAVTQVTKKRCYLAGWGRVSDPGEEVLYPARLMQLRFPMVPHKQCSIKPSWGPRITNKQICAGGDGKHDMCWGDSGGGLVCATDHGSYEVQGISSFTGHLCAVKNRPAIFTKVDRYLSWIAKIMKSEAKNDNTAA